MPMMDECLKKMMSCQDNDNKDIYTTEPSDEDLKANKNNVCTINKTFKDCVVAATADCNNGQVDMVVQKSTQMAEKCDKYMKEKGEKANTEGEEDMGPKDSATSAQLSALLLVVLPVVMQALVWM